MNTKIPIILLLLITPMSLLAQQTNEEDPFKRDPVFTKPLEDFFGIHNDQENGKVSDSDSTSESQKAVRRLTVRGMDLGGSLEAGPYYSNALYSRYPNLSMIHFNRVNGLFLGIRKERMQWHRYSSFLNIPQIQPHGFIGYGTASKDWEFSLGAEKLIGEKKHFMIGGEVYNASGTEDFLRTGLVENSLTSFLAAYDFMDYQKMDGFGIYAVYRTQRWFETAISYNSDTFTSLQQNTDYTLFGKSSIYRPNMPVDAFSDEIDLDRYSFSFAFNPRNLLVSNYFTIAALFSAELADNSASDEDYRYNKYETTLKLYYNFEPGSVLKWRIHAGGITGNAPDFKDFYLGGIGTLRGTPFKFFNGNQMVASNLEVQFGQPSGNSGEWLREYNIHLLFFLDSGWTRQIPELFTSSNPLSGFDSFSIGDMQHDVGAGIGTGAFRVEVAWPLKTFDKSPALWIRFNPTF